MNIINNIPHTKNISYKQTENGRVEFASYFNPARNTKSANWQVETLDKYRKLCNREYRDINNKPISNDMKG